MFFFSESILEYSYMTFRGAPPSSLCSYLFDVLLHAFRIISNIFYRISVARIIQKLLTSASKSQTRVPGELPDNVIEDSLKPLSYEQIERKTS